MNIICWLCFKLEIYENLSVQGFVTFVFLTLRKCFYMTLP